MTEAQDSREGWHANGLSVQPRAAEALSKLKADANLSRFVEPTLGVPEVFQGEGEIRLVVLGQDPTVKNAASRRAITTVLNLNKPGALKDYLSLICEALGLDLDQNVYATNYLKNFFVKPPTQIKEMDVFQAFRRAWMPLLKHELSLFPAAPVITLGQPLLTALVLGDASPLVRDYWGYVPGWKAGERGDLHYLAAQDNRLGQTVFPFPHQPSIAKQFYAERLASYAVFVRQKALSGCA